MIEPTPNDLVRASLSPMQELVCMLGAEAVHDLFTPAERKILRTCLPLWATPLQRLPPLPAPRRNPGYGRWTGQWPLPPGPWSTCVSIGGRGSGKTSTGAYWIIDKARKFPDEEVAIVAPTMADVWGTCVESKVGILAWAPPDFPLKPVPSKQRIDCLANKSKIRLLSADEPERMRSHNLAAAWFDEPQSARRLSKSWELLKYALRRGPQPQTLFTCNPEMGIPLLVELVGATTSAVVQSSSLQNPNLPESFYHDVIEPALGTVRGRETVLGDLLEYSPFALWSPSWISRVPVDDIDKIQFRRIGIGFDPAETSKKTADDHGIVAGGLGLDGVAYVTDDRTKHGTPDDAATAVVELYWSVGASFVRIDATRNGETYAGLIRFAAREYARKTGVPAHALVRVICTGGSKTKEALAAPVSQAYQRGRIKHFPGVKELEDQLCTWTPECDWSPDRMDATCSLLTELLFRTAPGYASTATSVPSLKPRV